MIGPDAFTFRALWRCYRNCRRNKRNTVNALAFEVDAEAELLDLQQALCSRSYRPGRSICFITSGVKPREVFAADFRDRVVHHLLVSYQERLFEPIFIHDFYACRRGKGTLAVSDRLMTMLRRVTANGRRPAWALKLDVASFFPSIHKTTLYDILARKVHHPDWLWLTHTLLFHDPTQNYCFRARRRGMRGPGHPDYPVAPHKSLFGKGNQRGLPIGNLTSQFWGNVYLNELDQFVKRTLKCRYYLRYVDDMVLLAPEQETLLAWCAAIEEFLRLHLWLALRPETTRPIEVRKGVEFVGWRTWWNRRLPRRSTFGQARKRLDDFERAALRPVAGDAVRIDLQRQGRSTGVERLQATLASYSGHLCHGSAWREWTALWEQYPWLEVLFIRRGWTPAERWPRRHVVWARDYRTQYARMTRHAGSDCLLFCQVGKFVEFYGPQRLLAQSVLGLRPAMLPRAGYGLTVGFPMHSSAGYLSCAMAHGVSVVTARQQGLPSITGCAPRALCLVFVPALKLHSNSKRCRRGILAPCNTF